MDRFEGPARWIAILAVGLVVLGYGWAVASLLRFPERKQLLSKLVWGDRWPKEAPIKAAIMVAAGLLCGLVAAGWFAMTAWSGPGIPDEPAPAPEPLPGRRPPIISFRDTTTRLAMQEREVPGRRALSRSLSHLSGKP